MDQQQYLDEPAPFPTEKEQMIIATFLDGETSKIDALIVEQQRLIRLLKEKRQALVSRAIVNTNSTATTRLGHLVDVLPGYAFSSSDFSTDQNGTRLLRGINVGVGECRWDETVFWPGAVDDRLQRYGLAEGDFVFGMDRPWISEGTRIARVSADDVPSLLVQRVARIRPREHACPHFVWLVLASREFREYVEADLTGVSVPHISESQIASFRVPAIDETEQESLAADIGRGLAEASELVFEAERAIDLLQERRTALISAAVTGKIDVRGLVKGDAA